jgi:hypothetical protein
MSARRRETSSAEVVRRVDQDASGVHAGLLGPLRQGQRAVQHVGHDVRVGGAEQPGPRLQAARVGADQAGTALGGHAGQFRVPAAPGVVEQVGACRAGGPADFVPPGIDADDQVRVGGPDGFDERHRAPDLLGHGDVRGGPGGHAAHVQDVRALGHDRVDPLQRGALVPGDAGPVERVGGAVDDGHDQWPAGSEFPGAEPQRPRLAVRYGRGGPVLHSGQAFP